jgi:hypothetical protein
MGFWNSIFGKKKKTLIVEDFFGELTIEDNFSRFNHHFSPLNKSIELALEFVNNSPNVEQIVFYQLIESQYDTLIPSFTKAIQSEFLQWGEDVKVIDFKSEFTLTGLDLPTCTAEPINWELYFDTTHDLNHIIIISMKDFDIQQVMVDG